MSNSTCRVCGTNHDEIADQADREAQDFSCEGVAAFGEWEPEAPFGWTVVGFSDGTVTVYKRDCPAIAPFNADLAPFTHDTQAAAIAAGKRGDLRRYGGGW